MAFAASASANPVWCVRARVCAGYDTHIASAIINLDQQVEEDWPVVICDHEGNAHVVPLHAGASTRLRPSGCSHSYAAVPSSRAPPLPSRLMLVSVHQMAVLCNYGSARPSVAVRVGEAAALAAASAARRFLHQLLHPLPPEALGGADGGRRYGRNDSEEEAQLERPKA